MLVSPDTRSPVCAAWSLAPDFRCGASDALGTPASIENLAVRPENDRITTAALAPLCPHFARGLTIVLRIVYFPSWSTADRGPSEARDDSLADFSPAAYFPWIESSSMSKMSVELIPMMGLGLCSPYAKFDGMKSCHLDPTGMSCRASVHPGMTLSTGNVAAWPRL